jgi:hypothetical protein
MNCPLLLIMRNYVNLLTDLHYAYSPNARDGNYAHSLGMWNETEYLPIMQNRPIVIFRTKIKKDIGG